MSVNNRRKCSKCGKTRAEDPSVSYHRFPKPGVLNLRKARAWAEYCWPNDDWNSVAALAAIYTSNKVLCGRHFRTCDYYDNKRQKLSIYALPYPNDLEETSSDKENICEQTPIQGRDEGPNPLKRVAFSQKENIVDDQPSTSGIQSIHGLENTMSKSSVEEQLLTENQGLELTSAIRNDSKGILGKLNVKKLKEMTPRETKLYKICKRKMKEIFRLRKKVKNIKAKNIMKNISEDDTIKSLFDLKISSSLAILLQSNLKNWPRKAKGRRYSLKDKTMALVLYKKSPACYRLLRRMFALPCQSSLNNLLNKVPLQPGINEHIFDALKKMAQKQTAEDNICILSFDEMSIRKHLQYNVKLDLIQGFQDHGNHGRSNEIASKALVFMLSGVRKRWKQPIAFYLSNILNSDRMAVIVKDIVTECIKANMNVVATVCDMSSVNMKVLKTLGATTREPVFSHSGREIVTVLDAPHLLKCTRNLFMKHDVKCPTEVQGNENNSTGTAKWAHVVDFYNLDKNNANFVFAPALTDQHIHPNVKQQMRVKLAAQIFSHSVTAGILAKVALNELPAEALTTASFLKKFDELFDAVNADTPDLRGGKKYSTNMTARSPHAELFGEMKKFISYMTYIGAKTKPPSQDGWIHTINAIERLWKNLQMLKIKSLSTRRLNQDPLENFFGCIRYSCGSNINPTIEQFIAGVKTAIIANLRHTGQKKNCEDDAGVLSNNLTTFLTAATTTITDSDNNAELEGTEGLELAVADAVEAVELATPEGQACGYVCGFIFKKLRNNNCLQCQKVFLTQNHEAIHIFTSFKEYNNIDSLYYIEKNVIQAVEAMAVLINEFLKTNGFNPFLKEKIMQILNAIDLNFLDKCPTHLIVNKTHLKVCTFFICIKRYTLIKNREIGEEDRKKSLERKMRILKNK